MNDVIGWVASIIMLTGGYGVAHKRIWGLVYFMVGNILWAVVGVLVWLPSLIGISIAFAVMDIYGIWRWKNEIRSHS